MMGTRNFRVRSEVVERGSVTKSSKRKESLRREENWSVFSGRHMDNGQKETHVVSVMTKKCEETCTMVLDEKDDCLLPHQVRRPSLTKEEKNPQKHQATERGKLFRHKERNSMPSKKF